MTKNPPRLLRFQLIFFVPVAIVVVLAGMLNLGSLQSLRQAHREANLLQVDEMARIGLATRFNQEIAAVQRRVTTTLEQAATGKLDEGEVYRVHAEVVNRLARLAEDMPALQAAVDEGGQGSAVMADFEA